MPTPTSEIGSDSFDEFGRLHSPFVDRDYQREDVPRAVMLVDMPSMDVGTPEGLAAVEEVIARMSSPHLAQQFEEGQREYLARFGFGPGDQRYQAELDRLVAGASGRALIGQARDLERAYSTAAALGGDLTSTAVWVTEGDDNVCDACSGAADAINGAGGMPYNAWPSYPGGDTCYGGSMCRCQPIVVDTNPDAGGWLLSADSALDYYGPRATVPEAEQWAYDDVDEYLWEFFDDEDW